jgi:hypothetical protein
MSWWRVVYDVVDLCVAPIYVVLAVTAVASLVIPDLNHLAAHGKTRIASSTVNKPINQRPPSQHRHTFWSKRLQNYYYHHLLYGNTWLVEKRYFYHFYVMGLFCIGILVGMEHSFPPDGRFGFASTVAMVLLLFHLVRRWYECIYVHQWKSTSKMHVAGYLLGLIHYALLPMVFCSKNVVINPSPPPTLYHQSRWYTCSILVCAIVCVWAQYEQHVHHVLLSKLRSNSKSHSSVHSIPTGRWFTVVSCPHFLAETIIYLSWAMLLQLSTSTTTATERPVTWMPMVWFAWLQKLRLCRPWILCFWVITNLAVSARKNHTWYLEHFSNYASLRRTAFIPFVW